MNTRSLSLVVAQISLIWLVVTPVSGLLLANTPVTAVGFALVCAGIILFAYAVVSLSRKNLTAMPEPVANGELIERGPYRYIRHPMYTALIISGVGAVIVHGSVPKVLYLLVLIIVLWMKINREEKFLMATYTGYAQYVAKTYKLIPRVY